MVTRVVRVTDPIELKPQHQTFVEVTTDAFETVAILPNNELFDNDNVAAMNAHVDVRPNQPFRILLSNYGKNSYRLVKGQAVATVENHNGGVTPTKMNLGEVLGLEEADE